MAISKRTYSGDKFFLMDLEVGFNNIRPRSAEMQSNRDGTELLYVAGWSDLEAAALNLLIRSNVKGAMLTERVLNGKVKELSAFQRTSRFDESVIGKVIMSNAGSAVEVLYEPDAKGDEDPVDAPEPELEAPTPPETGSRFIKVVKEPARSLGDWSCIGVEIQLDPRQMRVVKLLAVVWDTTVEKVIQNLVAERLEHYLDPMVMAQILGATDN